MRAVRVWDLATRLGHWLLAVSFAVAWLTAEREAWRHVHVKAGYAMLAVIAFRVVWGFAGTRHARFAAFVFPLRAVADYAVGLLRRRPPHYTGHNPLGSWSIFALLALGVAACVTGVMDYEEWGGRWVGDAHEALSIAMLWVVGLHLAGVAVSSVAHRENLVAAMVTGQKAGDAGEAVGPGEGRGGAVALVACVALAVLLA
ncbi:MAG: cytochrome b/b6 domain-containing protein [Betaproteobacteria bacterium]